MNKKREDPKTYETILGPYDVNMSKPILEVLPKVTIPNKSVPGDAMRDMWIRNFIRSGNWKPKTSGFYIDGKTGYAEFTDVYVSGNIVASTITGSTFSTAGDLGYSVTISNTEDAIVFKYADTIVASEYSFFLDAAGNGDQGGVTIATQNSGAFANFQEILNGTGALADYVGNGLIQFGIEQPTEVATLDFEMSCQDVSSTATPVVIPVMQVYSTLAAIIDFSDNRVLVPPKHTPGGLGAGMFPQTPNHAYDNGSIYFDTTSSTLRIIIGGAWYTFNVTAV